MHLRMCFVYQTKLVQWKGRPNVGPGHSSDNSATAPLYEAPVLLSQVPLSLNISASLVLQLIGIVD